MTGFRPKIGRPGGRTACAERSPAGCLRLPTPHRRAGPSAGDAADLLLPRASGSCTRGVFSSATRAAYGVGMVQPRRSTPLDEQLCFALYTASRAMTSCYRPLLDSLGLTYPQYLVMLVLWERGDTPVTGIGQALQLETGTLSPLLKRLEATGLITRTRQGGDERTVLVALTAAGRELEVRTCGVQAEVGEATGLTHAEIAELRVVLHALTGRLRATARS